MEFKGGTLMKRAVISCFCGVALLFLSVTILRAEVKTEEKSLVKFEGMMGRMMGMFAGKAAKEGIINTNAVKGNRKMTVNDTSGSIIDLDEQKIYELDMKKKTYEVVTFEEMRRRLQEAQDKAAKMAKEEPKQEPKQEQQAGKQMEVEFSLKESGQKKDINGFNCREVVMTITTHEKGKTIEQAGGIVMTSHIWLAPMIHATKEIAEFDKRYWEALRGPIGFGDMQQMAMMAAMYPGMKEMMSKMQAENVNMDGTPILTEMVTETVRGTEQVSSSEQKQDASKESESGGLTSIRGIGGMLGRKMARKKEEEPPADKPKNRSTVFTTNHELIKVSTSVSASDLAIPPGFKEKK
jgi:hypothetical protein